MEGELLGTREGDAVGEEEGEVVGLDVTALFTQEVMLEWGLKKELFNEG